MKRLFLGAIVLCMSVSIFGCGGSQPADEQEIEQAKEFVLPEEEVGTSAMVDALVMQAKADAETASEADLQTAICFIKDNYPDYYSDNTVTEKVIYYGALLQYYYEEGNHDLYVLGRDALEATKYVYRGAETIETESTQINLESVKEKLDTL